MPPTVRVLLVDDSSKMRRDLPLWLGEKGGIAIVASVIDAMVAEKKIPQLRPDVILLDLNLPRLDSLEFIRRNQEPRIPIVAMHPRATDGSGTAIAALQAGAFDVFAPPEGAAPSAEAIAQLRRKIVSAARFAPVWSAPSPASPRPAGRSARDVILIGGSTGGTEAITEVLKQLPADLPGICIVQHIPPKFSEAFAARLNELCQMEVREADGDLVEPGVALVAPGDYHLVLEASPAGYLARLHRGIALHHQRPAVDELFFSAAKIAPHQTIAALLTGMGRDGALGMKTLHDAGAKTIAQDEATSIVYGMPKEAARLGAVDKVLPLPSIAGEIVRLARRADPTSANAR